MLRTFIKQTKTPERADLFLRVVDLLTKNNYLAMLDTLEQIPEMETNVGLEGVIDAMEAQVGDIIESLLNAHCIQIEYDREKLVNYLDLLKFLLEFYTPNGYSPDYLESSYEVFELGDTAQEILLEIYDRSGHNFTGEPVDWITHVGIDLANNIAKAVDANQRRGKVKEEPNLITGNDQETLKKFAALYPDALAVKEVKEGGGNKRVISDLIVKYLDAFDTVLKPDHLATELLGFAIISETGDVDKLPFTIGLIESVAGATHRAMDVIASVKTIAKQVGLE